MCSGVDKIEFLTAMLVQVFNISLLITRHCSVNQAYVFIFFCRCMGLMMKKILNLGYDASTSWTLMAADALTCR
jgi:hypothetical protein